MINLTEMSKDLYNKANKELPPNNPFYRVIK